MRMFLFLFLLAMFCTLTWPQEPSPNEWSIQHNIGHTGFSPTTVLKPPLKIRWVVNVPGLCTGEGGSGPVVAEGKVVFRGYNQYLFCLDAETGELIWRNQVQAPEYPVHPMGSHLNIFSPCIAYGRVYAVFQVKGNPDSNGIRCFDLNTGDQLWKRDAGMIVSVRLKDSPQVSKGRLFLHSVRDVNHSTLAQDNYCYKAQVQAWNALTSDTLWTYTMAETLDVSRIHSNNDNVSYNTALCVSGDTVFASIGGLGSTDSGRTVALYVNGNDTPRTIWSSTQYHVGGYAGELQRAGDILLVNGAQFALNASTGAYLYTSGAAPYGKIAAVMNNKFWSRGYGGTPYSMLLTSGAGSVSCKLLLNEDFGSGCSAPRAANGYVYVGMGGAYNSPFSAGRTLFAWDENGNPAWWFRNTEHVCQDVAIAYDRVYWLTNTWQAANGGVGPGLVYCFENDTRTVTSLKAFCVPETLEQYAIGTVKAAISYSNGDHDTTTMSCYFSSLDSTAAVMVDGSKVISYVTGTARIRLSQYGIADTLIIPVSPPKSSLDSVKRINFQAAYFPFKYGWLADNGAAYSPVKGFGWVNPSKIIAIRDDRGGNNFLMGSFIVGDTSCPAYRIDVPDGDYAIRAGMGDLQGGWNTITNGFYTAFGSDTICADIAGKATNIGTRTIHVTGGAGITLTVKGPLCYLVICPSDQDICQVADDGYDCGTHVETPGDPSAVNPVLEVSPNPFNTSVMIKTNCKALSAWVFDIRGTCVGKFKPGRGDFTWNASGCPAGVYMIMVKVPGGKTLCRKLTLMK